MVDSIYRQKINCEVGLNGRSPQSKAQSFCEYCEEKERWFQEMNKKYGWDEFTCLIALAIFENDLKMKDNQNDSDSL